MNPKILADLRQILATLYPDEANIRRIVTDSGIDLPRIVFNSTAINTWHSVLTEAEKVHQIEALLDVVEDEYGNNQRFQSACRAYRQSIDNSDRATVDMHGFGRAQKQQSKPGRWRLPALFLGLLLFGVVGGGWYWGIFSQRGNGNGTPIVTSTIPATLEVL